MRDVRNLFRLEKKKGNSIKYIKDIRTLFESKEDYYEPIRIGNVFSNNYMNMKVSNGDKGKTLSIEEYLDKIGPYLGSMINNLKTQGEWKLQLTIVINFFSSKDFLLKKCVLYIQKVIILKFI